MPCDEQDRLVAKLNASREVYREALLLLDGAGVQALRIARQKISEGYAAREALQAALKDHQAEHGCQFSEPRPPLVQRSGRG